MPLLAVVGSTGTGKSQLGVELASLTHAEIVSADSMQTYEGLDVITNKAPADEMRGVPHHLLSFLPPTHEYDITQFVADATRLCTDMHERRTLPILVGGTTYYIQHLLFPGRLVSKAPDAPAADTRLDDVVAALPAHLRAAWDALGDDDATARFADDLWPLLHALDAPSAERWHHRDHRKLYRALCILRDTGTRQSEWVRAQDAADDAPRPPAFGQRRLLFWVWSERAALNTRLDRRIGQMVEVRRPLTQRGLLDEINALRAIARQAPTDVDYTRGIYQAIGTCTAHTGYKEFDAYLAHRERHGDDADAQRLFDAAIAAMQVATRRYAKRQTAWIRNQLLPAVHAAQDRGEEVYLYVLDATDPARWDADVRRPAEAITQAFLAHAPMPEPRTVCAAADELLARAPRKHGALERNAMFTCEVCTSDAAHPFRVRETERAKHLHSRTHRYALKRRTRQQWIAEHKEHGEEVRRTREARRQGSG